MLQQQRTHFAIATQIQRSFAGGIASADIFRERGVRALLGFEAGAKNK